MHSRLEVRLSSWSHKLTAKVGEGGSSGVGIAQTHYVPVAAVIAGREERPPAIQERIVVVLHLQAFQFLLAMCDACAQLQTEYLRLKTLVEAVEKANADRIRAKRFPEARVSFLFLPATFSEARASTARTR